MTRSVPYTPARFTAIACAASGILLSYAGLWFYLGRPAMSWYGSYLYHSSGWALAGLIGAMIMGNVLYWFLTFWGRIKQAA